MNPIHQKDTLLVNYDPESAFRVLMDLSSYPLWWPPKIKFQIEGPLPVQKGTKLIISNGPLVHWTAEVLEIVPGRSLVFGYGKGSWEGTGTWQVVPVNEGAEISYTVDIRPVPVWLKILGLLLNIGKLHSREMRDVLSRLEIYLKSNP